jgi:hypothetical protein
MRRQILHHLLKSTSQQDKTLRTNGSRYLRPGAVPVSNQIVTTLPLKEGLHRKNEKEKSPIQFELGTFSSMTSTLFDSGASVGREPNSSMTSTSTPLWEADSYSGLSRRELRPSD